MVAFEQSLASMPTSVLVLEQHFKSPVPLISNRENLRNLKTTSEAQAFPVLNNGNITVLNNARVERAKNLNLFCRKLKEFEGQFETELKWSNIIALTGLHLAVCICTIIGLPSLTFKTFLFAVFTGLCQAFGITGGVHRLWCHRTYTANLPLRIILMIFYSMAGMNPIYEWVRDHRVHHKYSETAADPHDANRGFFFAHMGWLMMHKKREVIEKGRSVDMSDILADPVAQFHRRFHLPMTIFFTFILPTVIPIYFWNETLFMAFTSQALCKYIIGLHVTWLVNSAAHLYGDKPYDKYMGPAENMYVSIFALGEGWHNYHHTFPWDYKAAELGNYEFNATTMCIDFFAWLGWATDLKTASPALVKAIVARKGDGTHKVYNLNEEKGL